MLLVSGERKDKLTVTVLFYPQLLETTKVKSLLIRGK